MDAKISTGAYNEKQDIWLVSNHPSQQNIS